MPATRLAMREYPEPLDLTKVRVYPLAQRQSLSAIENVLDVATCQEGFALPNQLTATTRPSRPTLSIAVRRPAANRASSGPGW